MISEERLGTLGNSNLLMHGHVHTLITEEPGPLPLELSPGLSQCLCLSLLLLAGMLCDAD